VANSRASSGSRPRLEDGILAGTCQEETAMDFRISGLPVENFASLFAMDDDALRRVGVTPMVADAPHAYPCRVTLEDALPGEPVLLLTHAHQSAGGPYVASGPIFIRRDARVTRVALNEVPEQQRRRLLSVRAYDHRDWMVDGDVAPGTELETLVERFFARPEVSYLQVHNARPGCYACRVDRVVPSGRYTAAA